MDHITGLHAPGEIPIDGVVFPQQSLVQCSDEVLQTGALGNKAQYSNPRVDELIALGEGTPNGPEREAIYHEIQDIVAEDIPYIGLFNIRNFIGRHANCGGSIIWPDSVVDYSYAYKIIE